MINKIVYQVTVVLIKFLSYLFFNVKIINLNYVPQHAPFIVASNHKHWLDIPLVTTITWKFHSTYIAKEEDWKRNILLTFWLNAVRAIPVDRINPKLSTIKRAVKALEDKEMLIIFPEGTRNKTDNKFLEFKKGIKSIAYLYENNLPILPLSISYSKQKNIFGLPKNIIIYIEKSFMKSETTKHNFMDILRKKMLMAYDKANEAQKTQFDPQT